MSSKYAPISMMAVALTLVLVLSACASGSPTESTTPTSHAPVASSNASVAPTPEPSASTAASVAGPQPTPGSLDPCTLLTANEASTLMGRTLGAGVSTTLDPDRACTFKSGLTEVKLILAPQAPDAATAQAYWDAERTQVPAGVTVTDLTEFDRSAFVSGSVGGQSISALFVIDGLYFFDLYCGFPACAQAASVAAAKLIVGRLP